MRNLKVKSRLSELSKFAATYSRKDVDAELKKIRTLFSKAKQNYERANLELAQKQQEVDNYQVEMNEARQKLIDLNEQIQTMDLTGADGIYSAKDETFYVLDGKRYFVDKSDISDVKMTPYKEYKSNKQEETDSNECNEVNLTELLDVSNALRFQ